MKEILQNDLGEFKIRSRERQHPTKQKSFPESQGSAIKTLVLE